jgi:hypothetical protein
VQPVPDEIQAPVRAFMGSRVLLTALQLERVRLPGPAHLVIGRKPGS